MAESVSIELLEERHVPLVEAMNSRLADAGNDAAFGAAPTPSVQYENPPLFATERYVAIVDGDCRGGYGLRFDYLSFGDERLSVAVYANPVSEGIINRRYFALGAAMLRDAIRRFPLIYGLGGGGLSSPSLRLMIASGWHTFDVPLLVRMLKPGRLLRLMPHFNRHPALRLAARLVGGSGIASMLSSGVHGAVRLASLEPIGSLEVFVVDEFAEWADEIWHQAHSGYSLLTVRDAASLNKNFPQTIPNLRRLRMRCGEDIGWAVVMIGGMPGVERHFGGARVGVVVDCYGQLRYTASIANAATRYLAEAGADIVVTNQCHPNWVRGFVAAGFVRGPSQYPFHCTPQLAKRLSPFGDVVRQSHFTRGDCDGVREIRASSLAGSE